MRVRSHLTGLVHEVPAGHYALTDGLHDVLDDPETPTPAARAAVEAPEEPEEDAPKPRRRRVKRSE